MTITQKASDRECSPLGKTVDSTFVDMKDSWIILGKMLFLFENVSQEVDCSGHL